ncbi:uncharacterized protein EV420DRAFT_1472847 [Desarmillaria tabescens]|uniref:Uncharacterized protein n=1 Tax=Armillaria tabescens TaxID=1929756 RepID=A0AA39TTG7_ARMTA|nr:uncharacterized protein EV420DRAFT_1472847 [Desarmillaria tabescens]KAK0469662.1 hypothetical protein EV420DRAFT_1472847 [Desarmillaria tabescens]
MFEFDARAASPQPASDGLFVERFEAFMDKSLSDIQTFATRENRSFEEGQTRRSFAEWHSKYLFQSHVSFFLDTNVSHEERLTCIRTILCDVSGLLETLHKISGVESFVLAVDPPEPGFEGFLGGSLLGREFWRNLRGGGDSGARAFRLHCTKRLVSQTSAQGSSLSTDPEIVQQKPALSLKAELYEKMRNALRTASGIRNAEMKWTNPDRLATYGVTLVGWPSTVPLVNPSSLKASQNKELLTLLENGTMKFVRIYVSREQDGVQPPAPSTEDDPDSFSWAIQFDDAPVPVLDAAIESSDIAKRQECMPGRSRSPEGHDAQDDPGGPRKRPKLSEHAMEQESNNISHTLHSLPAVD